VPYSCMVSWSVLERTLEYCRYDADTSYPLDHDEAKAGVYSSVVCAYAEQPAKLAYISKYS
jgi:hypothetical protein